MNTRPSCAVSLRNYRWAICAVALAAVYGCTGGTDATTADSIAITMHVSQLPDSATRLRVLAALGDQPARNTRDITSHIDRFITYLPAGTTGNLTLTIDALDAEACLVATGQAMLTIEPAPPSEIDATLNLTAYPARLCPLTLSRIGNGTVVSTPPAIMCDKQDTCQARFAVGTLVSLLATPGANGIITWSQACTGMATCKLTILGPTQVTATFTKPPTETGCLAGEWCFSNPTAAGTTTLRAVWGSSPTNVWASGYGGQMLHYDGTDWTQVSSGTLNDLDAMWGGAADDIWAVGSSWTITHYDGTSWATDATAPVPMTAGTLWGVWGTSVNDVWFLGTDGNILHRKDRVWSTSTSNTTGEMHAAWGTSATDVWAVGQVVATGAGVILRYNGTTWTPEKGIPSVDLRNVGGNAKYVWVVGRSSRILQYDLMKKTWTNIASGANDDMLGMTVVADNLLFAGGVNGTIVNYDGTAWLNSPVSNINHIWSMWNNGPSDVWAVGYKGTVGHYSAP